MNDVEVDDLRDCVNQIVLHITDGNAIEKEVVSVMGGEVFELHSERIVREATERYQAEIEDLKQQMGERDKRLEEKDKSLEEKDKRLEEKDKSLEEKDKTIEKKEKSLAEKNRKIEELEAYIKANIK